MRQRVALDLFCCAGGATRGLQQIGFRVVGVDIVPRPNYCGDDFVLGDALQVGPELIRKVRPSLVTASPRARGTRRWRPCTGTRTPMLIPGTRQMLLESRVPFVLENVAGAPLRKDVMLCGEQFGLGVLQHRYFEIQGGSVVQLRHQRHRGRVRGWRHGVHHDGPYIAAYGKGGGKGTPEEIRTAKGIDWTYDLVELCEAIPPAYTRYLGAQMMLSMED